jgi:hypothetical protein
VGGVWRHKKSGTLYLVVGVADDSNNVNPHTHPQVVYVSLVWTEAAGANVEGFPLHIRSWHEFVDNFEPTGIG